jgi:RHS repeat-associated protein
MLNWTNRIASRIGKIAGRISAAAASTGQAEKTKARARSSQAKIFAAMLLCLASALLPQQASAGWVPTVRSGTAPDFGGDYYAAAAYSLLNIYTLSPPNKGAYFFSPTQFNACHTYIAGSTLCGGAGLSCTAPSVPTINGCVTSLSGYQGRCICKVGDPIDPLTGNVFEEANDFNTAAPTLSARRYYNSNTTYLGMAISSTPSRFGHGWRSEYDSRLFFDSSPPNASAIDAAMPDGRPLHFAKSGSNWVLSYYNFSSSAWAASAHDTFYRLTTDGTYWYLKDENDTVYKYANSGLLQTISYRGGYQQTLTYDGSNNNTVVADSLGRQITFAYSNGLATSLTDPDGNVTQYTYTTPAAFASAPGGVQNNWVLSQIIYPAASGTPTLTYLYEDTRTVNANALTGITDENGNRYATWTYDAQGRALSSTLAGGAGQTTISYNDTTNTRTVTNALSKQFVYNTGNFEGTFQLTSIAGQTSTHTAAATTSYLYDTNGYISQMTDGNGNVTTYVHNAAGQETSRTEAYGTAVARTITTTWDAGFREPDEIVAPNLKRDFTYDGLGNLTQLTLTDTTSQTVPYSTHGQTRIWAFTYNASNLLHTVDGPLAGSGDTTTYAYNATGFVNSVTDPLGHITQITSTNGRGQPLTSIDPNGVTTNYTYDKRGSILTITVNPGANQSETQFAYDAAENISQITLPDGSTLTYGYDNAHRLTSVTDNTGQSITYTLDALGNATATVIKNSGSTITKQQTATFDELGRIMASIGAASQTTAFTYDLNDNQVTTMDPRSKLYGHAFDALNRLYQETDPNSYQTTTTFNPSDDPTAVADARSLTTTYVRDGFGDIIRQVSPDTGTTDFWYDANGAVVKSIDARLVETDYTNDNTGRPLTKTFPAYTAQNISFGYDSTASGNLGVGFLTSMADQSGTSSFTYDALGHLVTDARTAGANGYNTAYTYDAAGHILTMTYPSGRIVTYTRDSLGRIASINTKQNSGATAVSVASGATYEPFGGVSGFTFGNGAVLSVTYDQDYQLTGISTVAGATTIQNATYGYDPAGNITSVTDSLTPARSQTLTYDNLNRLYTASGAYGSQSYAYDGVGNRTSRVLGATTETYSLASTANQIASIATTITSFVPTPATYLSNGFQQRVQKSVGSSTTQFVYDQAGHLLEEADGSGTVQKEYIWLDDMPVAMVDDTGASPVLYFIHADQINTPQKLTDGTGAIVWDGVFDPFGNSVSTTGSVTMNVRFPGQYFDAESDLNQNWFRNYDPNTGRYIQSDPIGLRGGSNLYEYALSDPPVNTDLEGLAVTIHIEDRSFSSTGKTVSGTISIASDKVPDSFSGVTMENAKPGANGEKQPVSAGTYSAFVRHDHSPNRVELRNVPGFTHVQIHNGSYQDDFAGCFGAGTSHSTDFLSGSKNAMSRINGIIKADNSGKIVVIVGAISKAPQ